MEKLEYVLYGRTRAILDSTCLKYLKHFEEILILEATDIILKAIPWG